MVRNGPEDAEFRNLNTYEKTKYWARVHFVSDLKVGEFVTLRAPYVLI